MKWYGQFDPPTDQVIRRYFDPRYQGAAIEVGAVDGVFFSNTYALEQEGWLCLAIEANPEYAAALMRNRKHGMSCACGAKSGTAELSVFDIRSGDHVAVTSINPNEQLVSQYGATLVKKCAVPLRTLDECIAIFGGFQKIDIVSIDTEGTELDVLRGFSIKHWNPSLIVVEDNYGNNCELSDYLKSKGYFMHQRSGVNDCWISTDYRNLLKP